MCSNVCSPRKLVTQPDAETSLKGEIEGAISYKHYATTVPQRQACGMFNNKKP